MCALLKSCSAAVFVLLFFVVVTSAFGGRGQADPVLYELDFSGAGINGREWMRSRGFALAEDMKREGRGLIPAGRGGDIPDFWWPRKSRHSA